MVRGALSLSDPIGAFDRSEVGGLTLGRAPARRCLGHLLMPPANLRGSQLRHLEIPEHRQNVCGDMGPDGDDIPAVLSEPGEVLLHALRHGVGAGVLRIETPLSPILVLAPEEGGFLRLSEVEHGVTVGGGFVVG